MRAQREPQNIRTFGALRMTMNHLLGVMDRDDEELVEVQAFLWDRFREVRRALGRGALAQGHFLASGYT